MFSNGNKVRLLFIEMIRNKKGAILENELFFKFFGLIQVSQNNVNGV